MNLSDFIDYLIRLEAGNQTEIPVYVVDGRNSDSNLVMTVSINTNDHSTEVELLDLDKGIKYVEISVG
jgi:hypothetical protein